MAKKIMDLIKAFLHFMQHDLWRIDLVHDTKLRAFGVESLRVIHLVLAGGKEDNFRVYASALTYSTLMALAPFLVVLFAIANAIGFTVAEQKILEASEPLPAQLRGGIVELLDKVGDISPAALGGVSMIFFVFIILRLLNSIEESFNQVWGVQSSRSMVDKVRNYIFVLVISPVLMLVGNTASGALTAFSARFDWLGPVLNIGLHIAPIFILSLGFLALFIFLPNTKVKFKPALVGALTSATLVILVQMFILSFGAALFGSEKYKIYGSFAVIPIMLFWLHLNWSILLFGTQLSFALQNRQTYAEERTAKRASAVARLWVAQVLMDEAVRIFKSDEHALHLNSFAQNQAIPVRLSNEVARVLARARLLGPMVSEGKDAYVLLQSPEGITAQKIFELIITDGTSPKELGLSCERVDKAIKPLMELATFSEEIR